MLEKLNSKSVKAYVLVATAVAGVIGSASIASAQTAPDPTAGIEEAVTANIPTLLGVIAVIGGAFIAVAIAKWGWGAVTGAFSGKKKQS